MNRDKQYLVWGSELKEFGVFDEIHKELVKSKKPVQPLDRENLEHILEKFVDRYVTEISLDGYREYLKLRKEFADIILNLIPQQTIGTEDEIRKMIDKIFVNNSTVLPKVKEYAVSQLSSLAKPEQDNGEGIELCPECMAKHITKLSENGGIPI